MRMRQSREKPLIGNKSQETEWKVYTWGNWLNSRRDASAEGGTVSCGHEPARKWGPDMKGNLDFQLNYINTRIKR